MLARPSWTRTRGAAAGRAGPGTHGWRRSSCGTKCGLKCWPPCTQSKWRRFGWRWPSRAYDDAVGRRGMWPRANGARYRHRSRVLAAQIELLRAEQDWLTPSGRGGLGGDLAALLGVEDVEGYEFENVLGLTALPPAGDPEEAERKAVANSLTVWERRQAVETAELQLAAERERSGLTGQLRGDYLPPSNDASDQRRQTQAQARVTLSLVTRWTTADSAALAWRPVRRRWSGRWRRSCRPKKKSASGRWICSCSLKRLDGTSRSRRWSWPSGAGATPPYCVRRS